MRRTLAVCGLCLLLAPPSARAEWHFTPLLGATVAGNTTLIDLQHGTGKRHVNFGGAVSRFGKGIFGVEGFAIYTRHFFEFDGPRDPADPVAPAIARSYTLSMQGNVVLTAPKRWTEYFLRPYASGGFGLLRAVSIDKVDVQSASVFPLRSTMPAFNIGGGAIGFLSQGTGVRFDVRYHGGLRRDPGKDLPNVIAPDLHLRYMTVEVGLVIRR